MSYHRIKKEVGDYILSKYQYKCSQCGALNDLCVHHIIRMTPDNKKYNDIENLTVLCRSCHMSYHRKNKDIESKNKICGNAWGRRGKGNPPIKCKIKGCENYQHGRGLCKKHYEQKRRKGLLF